MGSLNMVQRIANVLMDAGVDPDKQNPYRMARAVIDAMREPTGRMVSEGESAASFGIGKPTSDDAIPNVWQAMIDAALAEKP